MTERDAGATPFAVLHIPHSSKAIPASVRGAFIITDQELEHEILRLTDHFTDELYPLDDPRAVSLVYPVSRIVVDPERFADDAMETMSAHGMGVIYTRTAAGAPLRTAPSAEERRQLLDAYYHPHHRRLSELVDRTVAAHGNALVLDCHSYPFVPFPYQDPRLPRPEICLGTDRFHTPEWLFEEAAALFKRAGFTVERNLPHAGAFVPAAHYKRNRSTHSLMIELRRDTYLNESTGAKSPDFQTTRARLQRIVTALLDIAVDRLRT